MYTMTILYMFTYIHIYKNTKLFSVVIYGSWNNGWLYFSIFGGVMDLYSLKTFCCWHAVTPHLMSIGSVTLSETMCNEQILPSANW